MLQSISNAQDAVARQRQRAMPPAGAPGGRGSLGPRGRLLAAGLLCCWSLFATSGAGQSAESVGQPAPAAASALLSVLAEQFRSFDRDGDGIPEINTLTVWNFGAAAGGPPPGAVAPAVLILVESRLLPPPEPDAEPARLVAALRAYGRQLQQDGWLPLFLWADVYRGERHQDGKTVLALRTLLQRVRAALPQLQGAVLVGSFPEAMLVRRWVWKHSDRPATFRGVSYNGRHGPPATWLAIHPELIAHRSDVVLADLDGNWEALYVEPRTAVQSIAVLPEATIEAPWPDRQRPIVTADFQTRTVEFENFFFIDDADFQLVQRSDEQIELVASYEPRRPELTAADRQQPNPLARPEISISRVNAQHVAVQQPRENLDDAGRPQAVPPEHGSPLADFQRDPALERRLLSEYFERNVAYRRAGVSPAARRAAALTTDLRTPSAGYFAGLPGLAGTIEFPRANAVDFVRFLQTPAVVKGVSAHSTPSASFLLKGHDPAQLDELTGGSYWHWQRTAAGFVPSYRDAAVRNRVHFALLRTLWQNDKLGDAGPCFYVHGGCLANSAPGAARHPYDSLAYCDHTQIAENLLFYGNGLALLARAKVFYDVPRGFANAFGRRRGTFGDVLTTYFDIESQDARLARNVASYDRAYFWSILGDWTLRLPPETSP